jgi:hypothetical protein
MNATKKRNEMRNLIVCSAFLLMGLASLQGDSFGRVPSAALRAVPAEAASAAAQSAKKISVPAGTRLLIRMIDSIDSSKQQAGYRFTASLETNLQVDNVVVAPRGTKVYGRLAAAQSAGRMSGSSQLTLELTDIYEVKGKGEGKKTARKVVGGAGLGALIGGVAGGGKGAGIGAAAGAAAGTAVAASKKGEQMSIPSETLLEFRLQQPAPLPVSS